MSILGSYSNIIKTTISCLLICSCSGNKSDYDKLVSLPYERWDSFASSLPLERRMDLDKKLIESQGHNPSKTIDGAFINQPKETYDLIIKRINSGDSGVYLMGIIYEINRSKKFKICSQPDRVVIQKYLRDSSSYPEGGKFSPDFASC